MQYPILLASSSAYRAQLLKTLGIEFTQASPNINEQRLGEESAAQMAQRLSQKKAEALKGDYPQHIIIASDQVASVFDESASATSFLGKPKTVEKAISQLQLCNGKTLSFHTGLTLLMPQNASKLYSGQGDFAQQTVVHEGKVHFRKLLRGEIDRYVALEMPLDCAGGFKSEGLGITLFDAIEFDDPSALIGLPLIKLNHMLRNIGLNVLTRPEH